MLFPPESCENEPNTRTQGDNFYSSTLQSGDLLPLGLLCRELSKFSVRLFVVCPSVRLSVCPCHAQFWTKNNPKALEHVTFRVKKHVRLGHFSKTR